MNLTPDQARKKLVEALRSGEYVQARDSLRSEGGYCCLGVACEIYRQEEGGPDWDRYKLYRQEEGGPDWDYYQAHWSYGGHSHNLPERVRRWLDFKRSGGLFSEPFQRDSKLVESLLDMNDSGMSFAEIADVIEQGKVALDSHD